MNSNNLQYDEFISDLKKIITPFIENLCDSHSDYTHIKYLGCGHLRSGHYQQLEENLRLTYKLFFSNGFSKEELISEIGDGHNLSNLIIPCFHNTNKFQINAQNNDDLEQICNQNELNQKVIEKLKKYLIKTTKDQYNAKIMLSEAIPGMNKIFHIWNQYSVNKLELTNVGIAIAHANYRRKTGNTMDLSTWIK